MYYVGRWSETVRSARPGQDGGGKLAATIRDIKKMTGLSLATVSKYLNGGNVLPENRLAIEHAIEVLHYEVNEVARGLATNKTKTVGVLIERFDNIFAGTVISEIEDILRAHDYGTIVCDCRGDEKLEEESIKFLLGKRVDGILTIPTSRSSKYLQAASDREVPVVLVDRAFEDRDWDSVLVDNTAASYEAVKSLIQRGHRKIAIICGEDKFYTARMRLQGYFKAMEEADLPIYPRYIKRGRLEVEHGYHSITELLKMEDSPTAVFLSNYEITLGAVIALNEKGVRFPDDISIIGFDNMMLSQVVKPNLWMVVQPMQEIARHAAQMLLDRMAGRVPETTEKITLKTSLLPGDSVADLSIKP